MRQQALLQRRESLSTLPRLLLSAHSGYLDRDNASCRACEVVCDEDDLDPAKAIVCLPEASQRVAPAPRWPHNPLQMQDLHSAALHPCKDAACSWSPLGHTAMAILVCAMHDDQQRSICTLARTTGMWDVAHKLQSTDWVPSQYASASKILGR